MCVYVCAILNSILPPRPSDALDRSFSFFSVGLLGTRCRDLSLLFKHGKARRILYDIQLDIIQSNLSTYFLRKHMPTMELLQWQREAVHSMQLHCDCN